MRKKRRARPRLFWRRLLIVLGILAVVIAAACGIRACVASWQLPQTILSDPDFLEIEDRYQGALLIPNYDLPKNTYEDALFSTDENGYRSYQSEGALNGVDVSSWQGEIDWDAVKAAGFDFAMLRIGFRGQTEGTVYEDERFAENYDGAVAAGLQVGVYFYSQAVEQQEAREEADFVLDTLSGRSLQFPVAYDWEPADDAGVPAAGASSETPARTEQATPEDVTAFTNVFCERIASGGYEPCYYTNKSMGYTTFDLEALKNYPIWYAEYQPYPSFYYDFAIWQYTNEAVVPGIPEPTDLNIAFRAFS